MVLVVNMIPRSLSGETAQDSEPTLAVNPANPQQIVGTAFTPDPLGGTSLAPIFVSSDGGQTWALNFIVPSRVATGDITVAFSSTTNTLYAGILKVPSPPNETRLNILRTKNYLSPTPMSVLADRLGPDQPYVQAITIPNQIGSQKDRVYVGLNDFAAPGTSTVDVSLNAAVANGKFKSIRLEDSNKTTQNGPQVRPVCHTDGTVYIAFYRWTSTTGVWEDNTLVITADVIVMRDDNGAQGTKPFTSLKSPGNVPGRAVASGVSFPFHQTGRGVPGQQRLGGDLAMAADPRNSSTVYLGYCDRSAGGVCTLHVRTSTDRGATWSGDLRTVPGAINPGLAVNNQGAVGLLYQQLTGLGTSAPRWETHFQQSTDGVTWTDTVLSTVPADTPTLVFSPYLGDYAHLMSVGPTFYGIFSANNTPDMANFPGGVTYQRNADFGTHTLFDTDGATPVAISIDPFFFRSP